MGRGPYSSPIPDTSALFPAFQGVIHHSGFLAFYNLHSRTGSRISGERCRSNGRFDHPVFADERVVRLSQNLILMGIPSIPSGSGPSRISSYGRSAV